MSIRNFSNGKDGNGGNSYENDYIYDEEGNEKIRPGGGKTRWILTSQTNCCF